MKRHAYFLSLDRFVPAAKPGPIKHIRSPLAADREMLAELMLNAYRGTLDDDGETIDDARQEIETYFSGGSGIPLLANSRLVEEDGRIVSACLASLWQEVPLIAYILTAGGNKRRGLARTLLRACLASLVQAGHQKVRAVITGGNVPSEKLFTLHGFQRESD